MSVLYNSYSGESAEFDFWSLQHEDLTKILGKLKEEDKFRKTDYIVDNEMEPVIINYCSSKVFWGGTTVNCLISFCAKLYAWCCSKSYNR